MKFKQVFMLFKRCYDIYDGKSVTDAQICQLGKVFYMRTLLLALYIYLYRGPHR